MKVNQVLYDAIVGGKRTEVAGLVKEELGQGKKALDIINSTLQPAMEEVGSLFSKGEIFLPELILAASAMKNASEYLTPFLKLQDENPKSQHCVVIGTVAGDLHDIGKNLVIALLEGNGYKVVDLGVDVQPDKFIEAIKEHQPQIVGFSALLTTTMIHIPETIKAIEDSGLREGLVFAVGGASMTERNAREWNVEIYAPDAGSAVKRINELMKA